MSGYRQLPLFKTAMDPALRQRLKRASATHIVLAQTGHTRTGFKRRSLIGLWQAPRRTPVCPPPFFQSVQPLCVVLS